jgi:hypothetical protein
MMEAKLQHIANKPLILRKMGAGNAAYDETMIIIFHIYMHGLM